MGTIPSWLRLSATAGTGNATITITASSNTELAERMATLIVTGTSYSTSAELDIYQAMYAVTAITFSGLTWVTDVHYSGGTATKANCSYKIIAKRSGAADVDVTSAATVSGSLNVPAALTTYTRHSVGDLTLTATYGGYTCGSGVTAYQAAAPAPTVTAVTITSPAWAVDIPASGGSANFSNVTYTAKATWSDGTVTDVTDEASFYCNTLSAAANTTTTRKSLGGFIFWVIYEGVTSNSANVAAYQAAFVPYITIDESSISFAASGGTATFNISSNIGWTITGNS